ncbi:MAG: hypothetical protein MPJ24_11770, partial [Pirellulaceae bacterium]|nr:hypothetical protein [Pirellulaceae bacterium]
HSDDENYTIIVSGFEPFGDDYVLGLGNTLTTAERAVNHSAVVASMIGTKFEKRKLDGAHKLAGAHIKVITMPVVWGAVKDRVEEEIEIANKNTRPIKIWIALGESEKNFILETVGKNQRGKGSDNFGNRVGEYVKDENQKYVKNDKGKRIRLPGTNWENGDPTYPIPSLGLGNAIQGDFNAFIKKDFNTFVNDLEFEFSTDAGQYICDETTYNIYGKTGKKGSGIENALFIHVPRWTQGKNISERAQKEINRQRNEKQYPHPEMSWATQKVISEQFATIVVDKVIANLKLK